MRLTPWAADEEFDQNFEDNIESEVQAFLFYLKQRWERGKMFIKEKEDRMWFDRNRLINEDLYKMMSGTQSNFEGSLSEFLVNMFLDTGRTILHFDVQYIWDNVPDAKRKDQQYIRNLLDEMPGVIKDKNQKCKMPFRVTPLMKQQDPSLTEDEGEVVWPSKGKQCRPYAFDAKFFLSPAEYEELKEKRSTSVGVEKNAVLKNNSTEADLFSTPCNSPDMAFDDNSPDVF